MEAKPGTGFFTFENKVAEAKGWLQWNTKRKNWMVKDNNGWSKVTFVFNNPGLATIFALKWA
jgi:hypothetical protein